MNVFNIKHAEKGMTLIEIMIALLLGSFLLTGVISVYLSSSHSYRMLSGSSRLQENGRFAMMFINRDIRHAGSKACWQNNFSTTTSLIPIAGTNNDGLGTTDSITLQMSNTDCPLVSSTVIYTIEDGTGDQPALHQNINGNKQELIEGVENMQILYGADNNSDDTPDYYVDAGTAGLDMNEVISVRVTLTLRTLATNLTSTGDGRLRRTFASTTAIRNRLP